MNDFQKAEMMAKLDEEEEEEFYPPVDPGAAIEQSIRESVAHWKDI